MKVGLDARYLIFAWKYVNFSIVRSFWISNSCLYTGHPLYLGEWLYFGSSFFLQFTQVGGVEQGESWWLCWPHDGQIWEFLQRAAVCPNSWQVKHLNGFGMWCLTLNEYQPALTLDGRLWVLNDRMNVEESSFPSFLWPILTTLTTPWSFKFSRISWSVQFARSAHVTTPLIIFKEEWGVVETSKVWSLLNDIAFFDCEAFVVSIMSDPSFNFLVLANVPKYASIALCKMKGEESLKEPSFFFMTKNLS